MNNPRGPSRYRNDTMIIVPARSQKSITPDTPSIHHGIDRLPSRYCSSPADARRLRRKPRTTSTARYRPMIA